ncbi:hypothetical protein AB1Y20_006501 [Prymnesium parvum]|uniref:Uncharacterized protein n=1 Tax=Prymnesium parvum TaxID=97485 RepID=A0AB34J0U3_PRYPA
MCGFSPSIVLAALCSLLLGLALSTPFPPLTLALSFLCTLSSLQLLLDAAIKARPFTSARLAARDERKDWRTRALLLAKLLQGFHPSRPFEFKQIGSHPAASLLPFAAWLAALATHTPLPLPRALALAAALAALSFALPFHPCAFAYTGRGRVHGFGLNLYATGTFASRRFDGERLLALDWHEEKLHARDGAGRWVPRGGMRTVRWPHLHLCALRLEFWPWVTTPTDEGARAMAAAADARRARLEARRDGEVEEAVRIAAEAAVAEGWGGGAAALARRVSEAVLEEWGVGVEGEGEGEGEEGAKLRQRVQRAAGRAAGHYLRMSQRRAPPPAVPPLSTC